MKVYIVTKGSYSDYHIEAVFTDEAKAKHFCFLLNGGHEKLGDYRSASVEEYEADGHERPGRASKIAVGLKLFKVVGSGLGDLSAEPDCDSYGEDDESYMSFGCSKWIGHIWAEDEKAAVKIAAEGVAQAIALNRDEWKS